MEKNQASKYYSQPKDVSEQIAPPIEFLSKQFFFQTIQVTRDLISLPQIQNDMLITTGMLYSSMIIVFLSISNQVN